MTLNPGQIQLVDTGIVIALKKGYEAQVRTRSGYALKGIVVVNSPGTIDAQYRGKIGVILMNQGNKPFEIRPLDRIAQLVVCKLPDVNFDLVEDMDLKTDRGASGFGSTGQ